MGIEVNGTSMSRLNPRVDFAFKKLFGCEENKDILLSFINAIVSTEEQIAEITVVNPINNRQFIGDKLTVLDIKAKDEHGKHYNIEMQITDQVYYNQRALYYWSRIYANQLGVGEGFDELRKTISINILNFNYFDDEPYYHNVFRILSAKTYKCYFEHLELHFIELKKFTKELKFLTTALDRWSAFLNLAYKYDLETFPQELKQQPEIEKAFNCLETLYLTKDEQEIYEARLKWLRDEAGAIEKAKLDGMEQGRAEGIEQGRAEGIEKVAIKLLQNNLSVEEVAKLTALTVDKVKEISISNCN